MLLLSSRHSRNHFENALPYFVRGADFFISPERISCSPLGVTFGWGSLSTQGAQRHR
jgi:hypothetical protein